MDISHFSSVPIAGPSSTRKDAAPVAYATSLVYRDPAQGAEPGGMKRSSSDASYEVHARRDTPLLISVSSTVGVVSDVQLSPSITSPPRYHRASYEAFPDPGDTIELDMDTSVVHPEADANGPTVDLAILANWEDEDEDDSDSRAPALYRLH
jgi:hypothetical protein